MPTVGDNGRLEPLPAVLTSSLLGLALVAGVFDLRTRRIPNWLVATGLIAGFTGQIATRSIPGLRAAAFGALLAIAVYLPLYLLRAVGGGDLKLMAAIGSIAGPSNWLVIFVLASLIGGALALAVVLSRGRITTTLANIGAILARLVRLQAPYRDRPDLDVSNPAAIRLPHGVSIAIGVVLFVAANH